MIKHIVMFKFKEGTSPETVEEMREQLLGLKDRIDVIHDWEVGTNIGESSRPYDIVVYSTFDSLADVSTFRKHPDHVEVAQFVRNHVEVSGTVDYEV